MKRNCWTCQHSGESWRGCDRLTFDEETDAPILAWRRDAPLRGDGTVPGSADGCPGWSDAANRLHAAMVSQALAALQATAPMGSRLVVWANRLYLAVPGPGGETWTVLVEDVWQAPPPGQAGEQGVPRE